jgi:polysaccharide pyruvyl transferase WcaK-like protein/sulfatase maturation enzyme AslB (radical SAM superfamily)
MCNIWKKSTNYELSIEQINNILQDKLFSKIQSVGLNGGEPSLRKDLFDVVHTLVTKLPKLKFVNIITNAINAHKSINQFIKIHKFLYTKGIAFNIGISVDGINSIHDKNRGTPDNFKSVEFLVNELKENNIDLWCGCTITPINCYWLDDVLDWFTERKLSYAEFRLAVDINRLNNLGFEKQNSYSYMQKIHIMQFLKKIILDKNLSWVCNKEFIRSLYLQLSKNSDRVIGCDWQYNGITLDPNGYLSYCSVKSPILGSCLEKSALAIYKENIDVRRKIIKNDCKYCMHDLTGPVNAKARLGRFLNKLLKKRSMQIQYRSTKKTLNKEIFIPVKNWQRVLIVGWWGTETAGDKAILGGLLDFINQNAHSQCKIIISFIEDEYVVKGTFQELEQPEPELVKIEECFLHKIIDKIDAVIIGGGPIENIYYLRYIHAAFRIAKKKNKERIIFGCGIDPQLSEEYKNMAKDLCKMATRGFFRDKESFLRGMKFGINDNFSYSCDPAIPYIYGMILSKKIITEKDETSIVCLIRANTTEYHNDVTTLESINVKVLLNIATVLQTEISRNGKKIKFLPMHSLYIGGDDRLYNRRFEKLFCPTDNIYVEREYLTLNELLNKITTGKMIIAMRYHGHLFSVALGIPFISIDYTGRGGKITNFVTKIDWENLKMNWANFNKEKFANLIRTVDNNYDDLKTKLEKERDVLIRQYHATLNEVFKL